MKPTQAKRPKVRLSGEDGNVYSIIGRCVKAFNKAGLCAEGKEFSKRALAAGSYDEVLQLVMGCCETS